MKIATISLLTLLLSSCATEATDDEPTTTSSPASEGDDDTTTTDPRQVLPTTTTGAAGSSVGGVPDEKLEPLQADAAQRANVSLDAVEVIRAQQVVWSSTALDCPETGQSYAQVLTTGYWVVLLAGDHEYDYRATLDGEFRLCVGGAPPYDVLVDR